MILKSKKPAFYLGDHSDATLVTGCRACQGLDDAINLENTYEIHNSSICFARWKEMALNGNVSWETVSANIFFHNIGINQFDPSVDSLLIKGEKPFTKNLRT